MRRTQNQGKYVPGLRHPTYPPIFYLTFSLTKRGRRSLPPWAARLCSPSLLKLRHVLHDAVHSILARRVRIGKHPQPRNLRTPLLAPYSPESQEEALLRRVTINLLRLLFQSYRRQSCVRAPPVRCELRRCRPCSRPASVCHSTSRHRPQRSSSTRRPRTGALLEFLAVLRGPPIVQVALRSNLRPWSSKPWVSSWPITTPMPPKFTASSMVL